MIIYYYPAPSKKKMFKKMSSSEASPYKVAIDFSFEHLMTDKVLTNVHLLSTEIYYYVHICIVNVYRT